MNLRFVQTTGALLGKERVRNVLERFFPNEEGCAIRSIYKRFEMENDESTVSSLAAISNNQRADSYIERATLTTIFSIMLNSMLEPGRPRFAEEFTRFAMPFLPCGVFLGITEPTRDLSAQILDDFVSDIDARHYLALPSYWQIGPDDTNYGDPERDRAFNAKLRNVARLCPQPVCILIRESISRCVESVRPRWEAQEKAAQ